MSFVTLVRHGQANNGARTEEDYDKLSELGHEQARLAGAYLAQTNHGIREVVTGSLNRQRDTGRAIADALGVGVSEDERLNEINYFALEASMQSYRPFIPGGRDEFILHFPQIMQAWKDGHIGCRNETFAEYEQRVLDVLSEAESTGGRLLATSGGIIGMMMRHVLDLSVDAFSHALLQVHNASIHQYQIEAGGRRLVRFNATPHFDPIDQSHKRTFI